MRRRWGDQAWRREFIFDCCWLVTSKASIVNEGSRGERETREPCALPGAAVESAPVQNRGGPYKQAGVPFLITLRNDIGRMVLGRWE